MSSFPEMQQDLHWSRFILTEGDSLETVECPTLTLNSYLPGGPQRLMVSEEQLKLMVIIYDHITRFPDGIWAEIIARTIGLHGARVLEWFKRQRDKDQRRNCSFSEIAIQHRTPCGPRCWILRLPTFKYCAEEPWTDDQLEEVLIFLHFRVTAKLRARLNPQIEQETDTVDSEMRIPSNVDGEETGHFVGDDLSGCTSM